ncbi:hypothetical protein EHEL_050040 [Encephalitozoon hellem ATCC 50504]|nr:uncharacterized protein EHEL_050040 [Encephalitozoon hellem ATCC 50504]AFM98215.1 hypothetical protein EHEL_050040 [Encephalitozoon hellem ATCC 50504]|eukprot:XP_003887196.1 hypothetical protein EHEL_050040 [Encephalitozoon hellem ATCC 50504]
MNTHSPPNPIMNIPDISHPSDNPLSNRENPTAIYSPLIKQHAATVSILLPIVITLLLRHHVNTIPLKLITVILPCLYSGLQYLSIFSHNRNYHHISPSAPLTTFHFIYNIILLLFSTISFLSIITLSINDWDRGDFNFFSTTLSPFLVLPPYLLDTSCNLTQPYSHYAATDSIDILLDLVIFLYPLAMIAINLQEETTWILHSAITIILFIRSYRKRCLPPPSHQGPLKVWRLIVPIITLLIGVIIYNVLGFGSLLILKKKLKIHA